MAKVLKCTSCNNKTLEQLSTSGTTCRFKCKSCGFEVDRKSTKADINCIKNMFKCTPRTNIHRVWHDFSNKFTMIIRIKGKPTKIGKKKFYPREERWRWTGYDLMVRVEKWAKKYKNDVTIVRCDDNYHAGSKMVLIQHRKQHNAEYMGTSIVFIPQCTGENPSRIFLYPDHHDSLIKALKEIKRRNIKKWNKF